MGLDLPGVVLFVVGTLALGALLREVADDLRATFGNGAVAAILAGIILALMRLTLWLT